MRAGEQKFRSKCHIRHPEPIRDTSMSIKPTMPPWLRQHLIDTGRWNADGASRKTKLRHHDCGLLVLHGLDQDVCAIPATVDPYWLTPLGEALAQLGGRTTYDYYPTARELQGPRGAGRITWAPATDTGSTRVLPSHVCGAAVLPHFTIPTTTKERHVEPPY